MSFLNKFKQEFEGLNLSRPQAFPSSQNQNQGGVSRSAHQQYGHNQQQQPGYYQEPQHQAFQYPNQQQVLWPVGNIVSPETIEYQPPASAPPIPGHSPYHGGQYILPSEPPRPTYSSHQGLIVPPPLSSSEAHSASPIPLIGYGALPQSAAACPTPPRWIPYYHESNSRWYFVETTGRSSWDAPGNLPPLPAMPPYPGISSRQVAGPLHVPDIPGQFDSSNSTVFQAVPPKKTSSSHTNTILAAAGGFAAGGVAGYFIKDRLDKRKVKKRHGRKKEDFEDLLKYPAMEQNRVCDVCDQTCYGPYARCQDCNDGDYDICRDCLSGSALCKGKGQHRLIKIFPAYACDVCDLGIRGDFYHCGICNDGEYDVCQKCLDKGWTCHEDGDHELEHFFIPQRTQSRDDDSDSDG